MNLDIQNRKSFSELFAVAKTAFKRYWRVAWAPALVVLSLVTVLSMRLPDYYLSDVVIFMQPQKISSKIVGAPEKEEQQERFEALIQELLSRTRLSAIIDRFKLYPEYKGIIGKEKALNFFHQAIKVDPMMSPAGKPLNQTFKVSFKHWDAKTAYDVTQALSNLFIEESMLNQRSETQGTEEFLDSQMREARQKLEQTEAAVQDFVRKNVGKLPEHRDQGLVRLQNMQSQMSTNSQMISSNAARVSYLQSELGLTIKEAAASGANPADAAAVDADPETSLAQLKRALVVLRSRYSDKHPDVINTKNRIAMLEAKLASGDTGGAKKGGFLFGAGVEGRNIRREIGELEVQTQALRDENKSLKEQIDQLTADIKAMPIKEQELTKINRDYANVKANYERLLAAKEEASIQSSLVRSQKGSQFRIVDPPSRPAIPAGPPRLIVFGVGVAAALLVFLAIPAGLFFFNGGFKFHEEAEAELEIPVIGVVPPMDTPTAKILARRSSATTFVASVVSFFGGTLIILLTV